MFLTDTSEDIDAYFRYIASKKTFDIFKWTPLVACRKKETWGKNLNINQFKY